jgi:heterodisulfide reductase subunit D
MSTEFRETKENRMDVRCCGGGGLLEATNSNLRMNIAQNRLNQVDESKAEILTSCCPSCNKTFLDALREQDRDIRVLDLAVYIAEKLDLLE